MRSRNDGRWIAPFVAVLAIAATFLSAVPAADAQSYYEPEPPGGWLNWQMGNVRNDINGIWVNNDYSLCQNSQIYRPGEFSEHCSRLMMRYMTGQIAESNWRGQMNRFLDGQNRGYWPNGMFQFGHMGGAYGVGYNGYFWNGQNWRAMGTAFRELKTPLIVGIGANLANNVVQGAFSKKKHADEQKTDRQRIELEREEMLLQYGVHPEQQKVREQAKQGTTTAPVTVINDPTNHHQRMKSLINATGCVVSIMDTGDGTEQFVREGGSTLVTEFANVEVKPISGTCSMEMEITRNTDDPAQGVLTCGPWTHG